MSSHPQENLTEVNVREFKRPQTLYVRKYTASRHSIALLVEFVKYERGVVHAKILSVDPDWAKYEEGAAVTARSSSCYLWGRSAGEKRPRCHWFRNGVAS